MSERACVGFATKDFGTTLSDAANHEHILVQWTHG